MTTAQRYGVAAISVAVASLVGEGLEQSLHIGRLPSALYLPAVLVATAVAGRGPGLLATVLGPLAGEVAVAHGHSSSPELVNELVGLGLYAAAGIGVAVIAGWLASARAAAVAAAADATRRAGELVVAREAADRLSRDAQRRARDFATLFEEAPIGIGVAEDVECRRITPNRTFSEMLGLAPGQNISQTAGPDEHVSLQILHPDGTPIPPEELAVQRAARTGQAVRAVEVDVVRQDGTRLALLEFAAPLFDDHGQPRGAIGAFLDVTRSRRASEEQRFLAEATQLVNRSLDHEHTLSHLVHLAIPQVADCSALDVLDDHGAVVRAGLAHRDPEVERRLLDSAAHAPPGPGARGLLALVRNGAPLLVADVTPDALEKRGFLPDQIAFATEIGMGSCLVVPLLVRDTVVGAFAWMRHAGRPFYDEQDVALAEEVARRASAAVENARLFREAQTVNRLKDEFVATLSHELRTPLNALLGWTELLKRSSLPADRHRQAVEAVERTARLQAQITNDLVDVSHAVSGKFRLTPRQVDAGEIIRSAAEAFRLAAESKGVRLQVRVNSQMPRVYLDPDRLQQVVFNLVANAVKFTPAGHVDVSATVDAGRLAIEVRDSGIGIRPMFLPYVFDRFRQADGSATRQFGGLGLGLSIVRSLVELHGGTVVAHSDGEGRGATFSVWIPVTPPVPATPPAQVGVASPRG